MNEAIPFLNGAAEGKPVFNANFTSVYGNPDIAVVEAASHWDLRTVAPTPPIPDDSSALPTRCLSTVAATWWFGVIVWAAAQIVL